MRYIPIMVVELKCLNSNPAQCSGGGIKKAVGPGRGTHGIMLMCFLLSGCGVWGFWGLNWVAAKELKSNYNIK